MIRPAKALLLLACVLAAGVGALPVQADPSDNPSTKDCLGVERGMRNRDGGDREHGGFGPVQSAFVRANQPYGQTTIQPFLDTCH
jgi:hypothetical protein